MTTQRTAINITPWDDLDTDVEGHGRYAPAPPAPVTLDDDTEGHGRFSPAPAAPVTSEDDTEGHGRWTPAPAAVGEDTDVEGHGRWSPAPSRSRGGRARRFVAAAVAAGALASGAMAMAPTSAGASVVMQSAYCRPGVAQVGQTVRADGAVNGNGQYVSTQYYFANLLGRTWYTPWTPTTWIPVGVAQHLPNTYYMNWGITNVWSRSAFWNGSSWYYTQWVRLDLTTACTT